MAGSSLTPIRLAGIVDNEGGVLRAIESGIKSNQITDPEIKALWRDLENTYERMRIPLGQIQRRLDAAEGRCSRCPLDPRRDTGVISWTDTARD
jgi:hypothetical protein